VQLPIGGVIRPGIKILTQAAQQNDAARAIYERGCSEGKDFDAIERDIQQAVPNLKSPLRPANVPYFVARRGDFPCPSWPTCCSTSTARDARTACGGCTASR
jgi:hypothetical protein